VNEVVIVSAVRTPIGRLRGSLSQVRPDDLAGLIVREAVKRAGVEPGEIEEVILGCANQAGEDNRNVARMALLLADLPMHVAGVTVNRLCASGLTAVNQAARAIRCGEGDVYVAGGVESMTRAPYALPKGALPFGPSGNVTAYDTSLGWRFPNPAMEQRFPLEAMGETAENIVALSNEGQIAGGPIRREEQDEFAFRSHARAMLAMRDGAFDAELVPVEVQGGKPGRQQVVSFDEQPRVEHVAGTIELRTDLATLASLRPAFRPDGTVTAGNSSSLNDGAAALVLMSRAKADELGLEPLARWVGSAAAGVDPRYMGLGPIHAARKLLERSKLEIADIDLFEVNEAFAAQAIAVIRELGIDEDATNVNGGAIALGHPLGCSGARILTTLVHALHARAAAGKPAKYGLATLCVGVGQGEATIVEFP
jgi:acetyl-CoA acetyltransferase family protein